MQFKFHIHTKVIFGEGCIKENADELSKFGKRAFIVTGKNSAEASGALDDITDALDTNGISFTIYDKVQNNPSLENVKEGGKEAAAFKADFIIGIGGGSPLDASKAIAVLAVNQIEPVELFKNTFTHQPLPVIAVPTTAGTGSEVTPYSILTRSDMQTKMSFGNEDTFPKLAFMDAHYTSSLSDEVTVNTAIDALSHAIEGYLSKRSMPLSDAIALEAIGIFGSCVQGLLEKKLDHSAREKLLYASMLGGMVIAHTGTTIVHGLGYSLTYFKGIAHGRANGRLLKEYFIYNYDYAREKIDKILEILKVNNIEEFGRIIASLLNMKTENIKIDPEEIGHYAQITFKMKSTSFNIRNVKEEDLVDIYKKSIY